MRFWYKENDTRYIMKLDTICLNLIKPFERLPNAGVQRLKGIVNPDGHDGIYLIRCSETDARRALGIVEDTKNMSTVAEMVRFVSRDAEDYGRLMEIVNDKAFGEAVVRHDRKSSFVLCSWVYKGDPVENEEVRRVPSFCACRISSVMGDRSRLTRAFVSFARRRPAPRRTLAYRGPWSHQHSNDTTLYTSL